MKRRDYCFYFSNGCGCFMNGLFVFFVLVFCAILGGYQIFLADWLSQSASDQSDNRNIVLSIVFPLSVILFSVLLSIQIAVITLYAGKDLHNKMIGGLPRALVSIYDKDAFLIAPPKSPLFSMCISSSSST